MLQNFLPFYSTNPNFKLTIEFLNHSEKKKKTQILNELVSKKLELESENNGYEVEFNPFSLYKASFRTQYPIESLNFNVSLVHNLLIDPISDISNFYSLNVKEYIMLINDKEVKKNNNYLINSQNEHALEIIYKEKPLLQRVLLKIEKKMEDFFSFLINMIKKGGFWLVLCGMFKSNWIFRLGLTYFFPFLAFF